MADHDPVDDRCVDCGRRTDRPVRCSACRTELRQADDGRAIAEDRVWDQAQPEIDGCLYVHPTLGPCRKTEPHRHLVGSGLVAAA